jgi:hypothetical protein
LSGPARRRPLSLSVKPSVEWAIDMCVSRFDGESRLMLRQQVRLPRPLMPLNTLSLQDEGGGPAILRGGRRGTLHLRDRRTDRVGEVRPGMARPRGHPRSVNTMGSGLAPRAHIEAILTIKPALDGM